MEMWGRSGGHDSDCLSNHLLFRGVKLSIVVAAQPSLLGASLQSLIPREGSVSYNDVFPAHYRAAEASPEAAVIPPIRLLICPPLLNHITDVVAHDLI